jgi:cobalt-precorrin-5B (C1)-methyltransferase
MLFGTVQNVALVEIPFPDASRHQFHVHRSGRAHNAAWASVIKDAGDDPDVTNHAEIVAAARLLEETGGIIVITGGAGVGRITKPGLAIPVGEHAINPVPRRMIAEAVHEAIAEAGIMPAPSVEITISIPNGEDLAGKTLNARLGIIGGLSVLGTTGIVKPLSSEAWTATISAAMDVARAVGHDAVVLSSGRTSEKAHQDRFGLPEECYVMMGDYVGFSLEEAARHRFGSIQLCCQWAKLIKIAMATPQTHVRHGALDVAAACGFLGGLGIDLTEGRAFNTAREIYDHIVTTDSDPAEKLIRVCDAARSYAAGITDPYATAVYLVSYAGSIIHRSR